MNRWKKIEYIILSVLMVFFLIGRQQEVQAEEELNAVPYSVNPIYPENQTDPKLGYFSLRMDPGQIQIVEIEINNSSDKDIEVYPKVTTAFTSISGALDYKVETEETVYDDTLQYPFSKIAQVESSVIIPAKGTKMVPVTITMPPEAFDGVLLGGVEFMQKEDEGTSGAESGMAIRNQFRYLVAFKLLETDVEVRPELKLDHVKADQVALRNVITASIQNIEPAIVNDLAIEAKVTRKGSDNLLYEKTTRGMQMAPNSTLNFPIYLGKDPFRPGKYTMYLVATARDGQRWDFKEDFEITKQEADEYNAKSAIELEKDSNLRLYIIIGSVVLLVMIIIFVIILKKKKAKKREAALQAKKKKSSKKKNVDNQKEDRLAERKRKKRPDTTSSGTQKKKKRPKS